MSSTGSSSSLGVADIVGIVIGGILGLATIIGLIISCCAMCGKKNKSAQVWAEPNPYQPPYGGYGQQMNTGYYPQQPPYQQQQQQQSWNKQQSNYNNNDQPPTYSSVYPGSNSYGKY